MITALLAAHVFKVFGAILAAAALGLFCELVWEHTRIGHDIDHEDRD